MTMNLYQHVKLLKITIIDSNEEIENLNNNKKNNITRNFNPKMNHKKRGEIPHIKNFPQYFFVLTLMILVILTFKFVTNFYKFASDNPTLQAFQDNKFKFKYFSSYLAELDIFSKVKQSKIKFFFNFPFFIITN